MPSVNGVHVTLEKYVETRFDELEKRLAITERLNQSAIDKTERLNQKALDKALETLNERLQMMNEFRAQMKDQAANFASKESVEDLKLSRATLEGKASQSSANVATLMGALALMITIIKLIIDLVR